MHLKPNSYFIHTSVGSQPGFILLAREEKVHIKAYEYPDELDYQEANKTLRYRPQSTTHTPSLYFVIPKT
jgi:hypothetical protein